MRGLSLLTFGIMTFVSAGEAHACSCMKQTLDEAMTQSQAIFEGTVTRVAANTATDFRGLEVVFAVKRAWKGIETSDISVVTASNSAVCGYAFSKGATYLVYAYRDKEDPLRVSLCSLTKSIDNAKADLKKLGQPEKEFTDSRKKSRCSVSPDASGGPGLALLAMFIAGIALGIRRSRKPRGTALGGSVRGT